MWRSVRQTPHAETSSRTWPSAGAGSGSSRSTRGCCCRSRTIARMGGFSRKVWAAAARGLSSVGLDDLVESCPLRRSSAGPAGGVYQLVRLEPYSVLRARHPRDVLLHQRPAEVVDAPSQALRR